MQFNISPQLKIELLRMFAYRDAWHSDIFHYGGARALLGIDRDTRIEKGELWQPFTDIVEKLEDTTVESDTMELTDEEILVCAWFLNKMRKEPTAPRPSSELLHLFYSIPADAPVRLKGIKFHMPFILNRKPSRTL